MARGKTNNSNTTSRKGAKSAYRYSDEFLNMHTLKMQPVSEAWLEKLAKKLANWAINDKSALTLKRFYIQQGICSRTVARWRKRSDIFNRSHEFAKEAIGDRREIGALTKKYSESVILKSMHHYDEEWRAIDRWHSDLKKNEQEQKTTTFNISMPNFSTDETEKKKDSEHVPLESTKSLSVDSELTEN